MPHPAPASPNAEENAGGEGENKTHPWAEHERKEPPAIVALKAARASKDPVIGLRSLHELPLFHSKNSRSHPRSVRIASLSSWASLGVPWKMISPRSMA